MVLRKKLTAGLLTAVCCMSLTGSVFAASSASKAAGAYGTLKGQVSGTTAKVTAVTSVTQNPDDAVLTITMDAKNTAGTNINTLPMKKSPKGIVKYTINWTNLSSKCKSVFETSGVQGGTKYKAYAVYTNTSL